MFDNRRTQMSIRNFSPKSRSLKGSRIKRRLSWDDEGVASTVGTIMALMIFLTFLSLFTNQYVPIWMEDNEASHMHAVEAQFCELKQSIDIQILAGLFGEYGVSLYTPITLGAQGVPMFSSPTLGILYVNPDPAESNNRVTFNYNASGVGVRPMWHNSSGNIKMLASNRYYVAQTLIYENDGIILRQDDGQLFKAPPQLNLRKEGSRYHMSFAQITIMGDNQSYAGFDTRGVQTSLIYASSTSYEDVQTDTMGAPVDGIPDGGFFYINQTTKYADAWVDYFNKSLYEYGLAKGVDYFIPSPTIIPGGGDIEPIKQVSLSIRTDIISTFTITEASFDVTISDVGV